MLSSPSVQKSSRYHRQVESILSSADGIDVVTDADGEGIERVIYTRQKPQMINKMSGETCKIDQQRSMDYR